jgi:hypothetical protein
MKIILCFAFAIASATALACPGGHLKVGSVSLTADRIRLDSGMAEFTASVENFMKDNNSVGTTVINDGDVSYIRISVAFIKKDSGGIIYTVYKLSEDPNDDQDDVYIEVRSNYLGNGMRARGMMLDHPYPIAQSYGC